MALQGMGPIWRCTRCPHAHHLLLLATMAQTTYQAYNGESVVLSGAMPVTGAWTPYKGGPVQMIHVPGVPGRAERQSAATESDGDPAATATSPQGDDCALEVNTDLAGHDLATTTATSPLDCCSKCKANPRCKFFTIEHAAGGRCWLKSSDAGRRQFADHVSGKPGGGPPPPPPPPLPPHKFGPAPSAINSFFVGGQRQIRARYPNGNPQTKAGTCFSKVQHDGEGCDAYLSAEGQAGDLPAGTT